LSSRPGLRGELPLGEGTARFLEVLHELKGAGFDGWFPMEISGSVGAETITAGNDFVGRT